MQDFVYQSAPMRVVFGAGTLRQLPDELSRLDVTRALVLATPRQKDLVASIQEMIGKRFAGVFTGAVLARWSSAFLQRLEQRRREMYRPRADDEMRSFVMRQAEKYREKKKE